MGQGQRRVARSRPGAAQRGALLVVALGGVAGGCRLFDGGLDDGSANASAGPDAAADAPAADARVPFDLPPYEAPQPSGPFALEGPPLQVGCSDGTREGFLDLSARGWPDIAGCAGGWSVPGLTLEGARSNACDHTSGDSSGNAAGTGCTAADLCARGWHVCIGPAEVKRFSASHCESVVPYGVTAFFAVAGGGSVTGDCVAGVSQVNDVRGCGNFGQPEADGCYPLDRRLEFGDCLDTRGIWKCGDAASHAEEAERVTKTSPAMGGVLCCRDER